MTRVPGLRVLILAFIVCASWSMPAAAQEFGVRAGASADPDQFYFGGHFETSPLIDSLYFRPNLEVGIGDDLMLLGANFEFLYKFPSRSGWRVYAGAGPALNIYMPDEGDSNTDAGFNVMVGAEQSRGLFFEFAWAKRSAFAS